MAEANEPIFSLSFPNPGGKAVAGHALASLRISVSRKKELIVGRRLGESIFILPLFPRLSKKFGSLFNFAEKDITFMPETRVRSVGE